MEKRKKKLEKEKRKKNQGFSFEIDWKCFDWFFMLFFIFFLRREIKNFFSSCKKMIFNADN